MTSKRRTFDFDTFYAAFGKSVAADVSLEDGEIRIHRRGANSLIPDAVSTPQRNSASSATSLPPLRPPRTPTSPPSPLTTSTSAPIFPTGQLSTKPLETESTPTALPTYLTALLGIQEPDGSWRFNDKFEFVLHGIVRPPPEGMGGKIWATAVVVCIWRQYPEYFAQLQSAYDKATLHVDEHVLELVRGHIDFDAIHQIRPYQNDEARRIRERLAQEAAAKLAEEEEEERRNALERERAREATQYGVRLARRLPIEQQQLFLSALRSEVETIYPRRDRRSAQVPTGEGPDGGSDGPLQAPELSLRVGDVVECRWRRVDPSQKPRVQATWSPCRVTALEPKDRVAHVQFLDHGQERERNVPLRHVRLAPGDARGRRARAFEALQETWQATTVLSHECRRLEGIVAKRRWRKPWEIRVLADDARALPARDTSDDRPSALMTMGFDHHMQAQLRQLALEPQCDELYQVAATALVRYEQALEGLRGALATATRRFRTAQLFRDRFHAFDGFLTCALALTKATVDAIECIDRWTIVQQQQRRRNEAQGDVPSGLPLLFIWRGRHFVSTCLYALDFLGSHQALVEWYGEDFAFTMNPFLRAKSVRDLIEERRFRVTSKMPCPMRSENALRVALKLRVAGSGESTASDANMPAWWPEVHYDSALRERLEAAEHVVIRELLRVGMIETIACSPDDRDRDRQRQRSGTQLATPGPRQQQVEINN